MVQTAGPYKMLLHICYAAHHISEECNVDSVLIIRQFVYTYWAGSTKYTSLHAYFVHTWCCSLLTLINFIPTVQNLDTVIPSKAYKGEDTMCADVWVNVFYLELAISRTINWPASMVTHYSLCNNVFHIATCLECNSFTWSNHRAQNHIRFTDTVKFFRMEVGLNGNMPLLKKSCMENIQW